MNDYSKLTNNELNEKLWKYLPKADYADYNKYWNGAVRKLPHKKIHSLYSSLKLRAINLYNEDRAHSDKHSLSLNDTPLAYETMYIVTLPQRIKAEALLAVLEDEDAV